MSGLLAGLSAGAVAGAGLARWYYRRLSAARGRYLAFAIHEFNSPITAVNMTIFNLLSGVFGKIDEGQKPWIEMMREQTGRLNAMVGEFRDLVNLELTRDLALPLQEVPAAEIAEAAAASIRGGLAQAGVALRLDIAVPLPKVRADPDRLVRTLSSILFHARKFRSSGDIRLAARASAAQSGVEFEVEYLGPRLTPSQTEQSLRLFYPSQGVRDNIMVATGLGLGILRALMRRQGGDLRYEVEPSGVSRLILVVPAAGV